MATTNNPGVREQGVAMDPTIVVGYLVARLIGGATSFANEKVKQLLDELFDRVRTRLAGDLSLETLTGEPKSKAAQTWTKVAIENAARTDPAFAGHLADLQAQLQRAAPDLLVYAPGAETVVGVNHGYLIQGGTVNFHTRGPNENDLHNAPLLLKALVSVGLLMCVTGLGIFFFTLFGESPDPGEPGFGKTPAGVPLAFGVFFVGFVAIGVASTFNGLRKRDATRNR